MARKREKPWWLWTLMTFTISIVLLIIFQQFITVHSEKIQQLIGAISFGVAAIITENI